METKTYRWNGKHGKGAMRSYRDGKRRAAEARNEATYTVRMKRYRQSQEAIAERMKGWRPYDLEPLNIDQMGLQG
jgi:hypothetical protein